MFMIIVYDFKIPADGLEKSKNDEEIFSDYFINYLNSRIPGEFKSLSNFLMPVQSFDVKILKKSRDLRQKEQKTVFKVLIRFNSPEFFSDISGTHGVFEDAFLKLLNKAGIKARKADSEEENLFKIKPDYIERVPETESETESKSKNVTHSHDSRNKTKVLIAGMGPAGIFAAAYLLDNGIKPILIEKGKRVEDRIKDVENLLHNGKFNKKSNVVFGEGGAGTFSDGKLTTRKNDKAVSYVLNFLVKMGANPDILIEHKPHVGSDNLIYILRNIRNYLSSNGAEIYFEEELKDLEINENGSICSAKTDKRSFETDLVILASGSNSYDTYEILRNKGVIMERKPFALGFRIEHKRDFVDGLFFKGNIGKIEGDEKAEVKLKGVNYNISSKKYGGYSFCMCPGGVVINSSADENLLCINGMSYSGRDLENSNSAVVAAVRPEMLDGIDSERYSSGTGALQFRKDLELKAYEAGGGSFAAPYQWTPDYIKDVYNAQAAFKSAFSAKAYNDVKNATSTGIPVPSYKPSVMYFNLFKLLPDFLNMSIAGSLTEFENRFKGFAAKSVLTGLETGTSSAVRIKRNSDYESVSVKGLYPCGEGSGYSGGIITSAIDGIRCAEALTIKNIK